MIRPLFRWLSPPGPRARLSILIFHRVLPQPDPLFPGEIDAMRFSEICAWLGSWFNVLPLDQAVQRLRDGSLPGRPLSITFDDGYADNYRVALPILLQHGLTATFFISTGFLDGGRMWNDTVIESIHATALRELDLRGIGGIDLEGAPIDSIDARRAAIERIIAATKYLDAASRQAVVDTIAERAEADLPDDRMMTSVEVIGLRAAGMHLGAHRASPPILARLDRAAARSEIEEGKRVLEALTTAPVELFAYPNGKPGEDYSDETVALVREAGFSAAVSTASGVADRHSDPFQLPRFTPWDRSRLKFGVRLGLNLWTG